MTNISFVEILVSHRLHHAGLVNPVIQITLVTIITTKKICFFQIAFQKTTIREK